MLRIGANKQAESFFREKVDTHADSLIGIEAKYLLGISLAQQGRSDEALRVFEQALASSPSGDGADVEDGKDGQRLRQSILVGLSEAARILASKKDFKNAAVMASRAHEMDPKTRVGDDVKLLVLKELRDDVEAHWPAKSPRQDDLLAILGLLPITDLDVSRLELTSLEFLSGMKLKTLNCSNNRVRDLSPLKGMPLTDLNCRWNFIADLSALKDMPLKKLDIDDNSVSDLSPLQGMRLVEFSCAWNSISDLSPLSGMPLVDLDIFDNYVSDLLHLKGMKLTRLICCGNQIRDISPLSGMPIKDLMCGHNIIHDLSPISEMPLEGLRISGNPIEDLSVISRLRSLRSLNCGDMNLSDLKILEGLDLWLLDISNNDIVDLSPLSAMNIAHLYCSNNQIRDLSPISNMKPIRLILIKNHINDLSPLNDMNPVWLYLSHNRIHDLSPISGMQTERLWISHNPIDAIEELARCQATHIEISGIQMDIKGARAIASMPIKHLSLDPAFIKSDALDEIVAIKTLVSINSFKVSYFASIAQDLKKCMSGESVDLKKHARLISGRPMLIVPVHLTRKEAVELAIAQKTKLASVSTQRCKDELHAYVMNITNEEIADAPWKSFHVAGSVNENEEEVEWDNGDPWNAAAWSGIDLKKACRTAVKFNRSTSRNISIEVPLEPGEKWDIFIVHDDSLFVPILEWTKEAE